MPPQLLRRSPLLLHLHQRLLSQPSNFSLSTKAPVSREPGAFCLWLGLFLNDVAEAAGEFFLTLADVVEALERVVQAVGEVGAFLFLAHDAGLVVLGDDGDAGAGDVVRVACFDPIVHHVAFDERRDESFQLPLETPRD